MKQLQGFEKKLKSLRYQDNQQARFLEDYTTISNRLKKGAIDTLIAGMRSDCHQLNQNTTKDRVGCFGVVIKGRPNIKPIPIVRDERADFGKAAVSQDKFNTRWIHKVDQKPHTYYSQKWGTSSS